MKKTTKIALIVVCSLAAIVAVGIMSVDIWASRLTGSAIRKTLAGDTTGTTYMSIGKVHVLLMSGCVGIEDIYLSSDTSVIALNGNSLQACAPDNKKPGMGVYIPYTGVDFIQYIRYLRHKELEILNITVHEPQVLVYIDEKHPETCLPTVRTGDTLSLEAVSRSLKKAELANLHLERLSAELKSVRTRLHVKADSLSLALNDLAFNLQDTTYAYNDSVYALALRHAYVRLPDGSAELDTRGLETEDAGALLLGRTRFRNLTDSKKMAEKAKDYITWVDITVNRVETSPFNPVRKALAQDWTLDSLYADVETLHVIRDQHIDPHCKFPTPQEFLMQIPAKFAVRSVRADVNTVHIDFTLDAVNYGQMNLRRLNAALTNVSNRPNTRWTNHVRGTLGGDSRLDATFVMQMNRASGFEVSIEGTNVELGALNGFLKPVVGLTCESHVDTLRTHYAGDQTMARGDFLMMYHGLDVRFHKEQTVVVKEIRNYGSLIQGFANNLIPKSNPTAVDVRPRKYAVEWKHDDYKPYPLYVVGPVIIGTVQTFLPGLYVHKQIRD